MAIDVLESEDNQLVALDSYNLLVTDIEPAIQDVVRLAAQFCQTPMAAMALLDNDREWYKTKVGFELEQTSRDTAFSSHALVNAAILTLPDISLDARFAANSLVTGPPSVRFYSGAPLITTQGDVLGALCVMDRVPRVLTPAQQGALPMLASQVMALIELRRQAREAKQQAEAEAHRYRSEFLSGISREIRTPLNGIIGMTGLLLDDHTSPARRELALIARTSAESLLVLINDILDFSKIEAGEVTVKSLPFDLRREVEEVAELLAVGAQARGLTLNVHYAADAPRRIIGDARHIRQILVNLAGNAIKFTSVGQVLIRVDCLHRSTDRAQLRISVADTGVGITAEQLTHIFEPFMQAEASTTGGYSGPGLGLAICDRLARLLNGTLEVHSTPGEGATFSLTLDLPIAPDAQVPPVNQTRNASPLAEATGTASLGAVRLLIVEDNTINQRVAQLMLAKPGRRIDVAANGMEALRMLEQATYDLVLMDCRMPEMDGYEATRQIRARERGKRHTPIVALTASATEEDRETCLAAGMDDFLPKPIHLADLDRILARHLRAAEPPAPPIQSNSMEEPPFDLAALKDRIGKDPTILGEFARLFIDETSRLLAACHETVRRRDGAALSRDAHALRGILMNLENGRDAVQAVALTRLLEQRGQVEGLRGAAHLLTTIEARLKRITAFLQTSILADYLVDSTLPSRGEKSSQ